MKEIYTVQGMTCAACSARIEKVIGKMDGVEEVSVNLASERMTLRTKEGVDLEEIFAKIEKLGYKVETIPDKDEEVLRILGMTCAACSTRVEKMVGRMDGVEKVSVNLSTERMTIRLDRSKTSMAEVKKMVEKAGYQWEDIQTEAVDKHRLRKEKEIKTLKTKLIVAMSFSIPLIYIAMGHMIPGIKAPLPEFLSPKTHPLNLALAQLFLLIPVLIAGNRFYKVGFRAIRLFAPNMDSLIALGTSAALLYSLYTT